MAKAPVVKKVEKSASKGGAKKRPVFDPKTAVMLDADGNEVPVKLTDDGRLTGVPTNWSSKFKPLVRADFNSRATFLTYRAEGVIGQQIKDAEARIEKMKERQADMMLKAAEAEKGGDPVARKKRRAEKLRKQLAQLEEQLKADGIEL